jgi:hypothetical protein
MSCNNKCWVGRKGGRPERGVGMCAHVHTVQSLLSRCCHAAAHLVPCCSGPGTAWWPFFVHLPAAVAMGEERVGIQAQLKNIECCACRSAAASCIGEDKPYMALQDRILQSRRSMCITCEYCSDSDRLLKLDRQETHKAACDYEERFKTQVM